MTRLSRADIYTLLSVMVFILLGAWAHLSAASDHSKQIATLTDALERQREVRDGLPDVDQTAILQGRIDHHLSGGVPALLTQLADDINTLASENYNVSTAPPVVVDDVALASINITLEGSYTSTYELIRRITAYSTPVRVRELIITRNQTSPNADLSVLIRLSVITNFI